MSAIDTIHEFFPIFIADDFRFKFILFCTFQFL